MESNNNSLLKTSLSFLGGVTSGILITYTYNKYYAKENRYTKTHYNIIINDTKDNELLESYYIDYDNKKIFFEKNLENVNVIFYTTNSENPVFVKKNFTGNSFLIDF